MYETHKTARTSSYLPLSLSLSQSCTYSKTPGSQTLQSYYYLAQSINHPTLYSQILQPKNSYCSSIIFLRAQKQKVFIREIKGRRKRNSAASVKSYLERGYIIRAVSYPLFVYRWYLFVTNCTREENPHYPLFLHQNRSLRPWLSHQSSPRCIYSY